MYSVQMKAGKIEMHTILSCIHVHVPYPPSLFGGSVTCFSPASGHSQHTECIDQCLYLQVEIESGRLLFRHDLSPVADVGLRQDLLDMLLLNYSHVWLRIGLEVHVYLYMYTCT